MEDKIIEALNQYSNFTWNTLIGPDTILITAALTINDRPMVIEIVHLKSGFEDDRLFPATIEFIVGEVADAVADKLIQLEESD